MEKLCVFLVLALVVNQALSMNLRQRRQADSDEDLEDRYGWSENRPSGGRFPGQGRPNRPGQGRPVRPGQNQGQQVPTTPAPTGPTTVSSAVLDCIRTCPVTPEYNPVCGTDNVTYDNPGRLICARDCGTNVALQRSSRCPAASG